ncbi:MAG: helix-turn-helix transcriptional regulator [Lachnospiraceae bacterium]|nr:helix-turn-helix transcriptional regulator [Lachnospiraceae bacterium]
MEYTFSTNLRIQRKKKNMTQRELAKRINVNSQQIYRWENDIIYPPLDKVFDIARVLEIDIMLLLRGLD